MAAYGNTRPLDGGHLFGGRMNQIAFGLFGKIIAWNDARVTRKILSQLTDRELDDIGLNRGDIEHITA